jgi:tetratricopeptide (TPR) repeat protein
MTKAMWGLLGVVLTCGLVSAQPKAPDAKPAAAPKPGEKAGTDESLQQGGDHRPWAAGISVDRQKQALLQFREGNTLLNQGLFARASDTYRKALVSWPHPAIHYNLALAQMNLDQPIEAFENLQKAIVYGDTPLEKDKLEHAKEYMLLLEKQIAQIEVSCDKVGAKVSVDGKEVFVGPGTFKSRVRIGRHTFVAEKTGYSTRINAPFIGSGENFRIELKLYTSEELTRYTRRFDKTWMPYAVIGGGIAVGLVGVAFELSANASYNDYDARVASCNVNNMGCPTSTELTDLRESGDQKKMLGYVSYGVAGAAIGTGVLLAILNRPKAYTIRPEDLQAEQAKQTISVTPIITPHAAGAMLQGKF